MDNERLESLIYDLERNLPQMKKMMDAFGGGLMGEMIGGIAFKNTEDVIIALKELKELQHTKKLLDG